MDCSDKKTTEEMTILWTQTQPTITAFVSSVIPDFQDADDILQQVAVAIVKNYDKYDKTRSFVAWAIGIAKNEIQMHYRNTSRKKVIFSTKTIQAISDVYEKESVKFDDTRKALDICIKKLKGQSKYILKMRYLSEMSVPRISQKLGMNQGAIYTTLHRIRLALRDCINRQLSSGDAR